MSMRNIEKYIENIKGHIPEDCYLPIQEAEQLANDYDPFDIAFNAWYFGFEAAYRAAKRGELDFQNKKGGGTRQKINELLTKITDEEQLQRIYEFMKYVYIQPDRSAAADENKIGGHV